MFFINLNAEIVACILSFRNRATSQIWKILPNMVFPPIWGKNGDVLSMRMLVIMDPGSANIWGGKKGEFRDWTKFSVRNCTFKAAEHSFLARTRIAKTNMPLIQR